MIDTDTRHLRRDFRGFTSGAGKIPCDHCGFRGSCSSSPQSFCKEFLPTIPFNDQTGMHAVFNTVRIGKAWVQRLDRGSHIALYDTPKKQIFGHAIVLDVFCGPIKDMLQQHAHANHLMLGKEPQDAADALYEWQLRQYGPRIVNDLTQITAVYLLRDHCTDAQALLEKREEARQA